MANNAPMNCAENACMNCARATYANAVVMPQLGHGMPSAAGQEHMGKPICSCVPIPRASGVSVAAITKGANNAPAKSRTSPRVVGLIIDTSDMTQECNCCFKGLDTPYSGGQNATMTNSLNHARIDGHLDLAYLAMQGIDLESNSIDRARYGVNFPALMTGEFKIIFATLFTEVGCDEPWGYANHMDVDAAARAARLQLRLYQGLESRGVIRIVRTQADLNDWNSPGPIRVVILMEGADPIESPERAKWWFEQGVRMVGLTWAKGSRYAGGNAAPGALTAAGRDMVQSLDALGIIHDLSHLSDQACAQVIALSKGAIVSSHSNCRSLVPGNERHLTDETIRAISARAGVCGLNLYGKFLAHDRVATMDDVVRHVKHVREVGGAKCLAFGSDFDGGFTPSDCPARAQRPEDAPHIEQALAQAGLTPEELAGFRSENWLRVLRASLPKN